MAKHLPFLVFSKDGGKIMAHPYLRMTALEGAGIRIPRQDELTELPKGSVLYYLPQRKPVGFNLKTNSFEVIAQNEVSAACCFMVPTYMRLLLPGYKKERDNVGILPLWAYTAVGYYGGKFYAASIRVDKKTRQFPHYYSGKEVRRRVKRILSLYPKNRLIKHLCHCALSYNCLAAKNFFMHRWEAPLPASRYCNSACLGCLSLQPKKGIASHERIAFTPSPDELSEVALCHIAKAKRPIVSFGQGCEGEPLLARGVIEKSILLIRKKTKKGTININTNASKPASVEALSKAGLDSMRVSLNSARRQYYNRYFMPRGYSYDDVVSSILIAKKNGVFVSVNLLTFPGFSDCMDETAALINFIRKTRIDMLQLKNLNIDPEIYFQKGFLRNSKPLGMLKMLLRVRKEFPKLKISYFIIP